MGQRKAQPWLHVLGVVLQATRRPLEDPPSRSLTELAPRRGGAAAEATALVVPTDGAPNPRGAAPIGIRLPPLRHDGTERRIVHDPSRLRKSGVRARIMAICGALHHFRVRLTPWQPMVSSK